MRNLKKIFLIVTIFLHSCHSAEDYRHSRNNLNINCQTIEEELYNLSIEEQKIAQMNKFSFSNMLVLPAIIRTFKIIRNGDKIKQQKDKYKNLKIAKNCSAKETNSTNKSGYPYNQASPSNSYTNYQGQNYNMNNQYNYSGQKPNYNNSYNYQSNNLATQGNNYNQPNHNYQAVQGSNYNQPNYNYQNNNLATQGNGYNQPNYNYQNNSQTMQGNYYNQPVNQQYNSNNEDFMGFGSDPIASQYMKQFR